MLNNPRYTEVKFYNYIKNNFNSLKKIKLRIYFIFILTNKQTEMSTCIHHEVKEKEDSFYYVWEKLTMDPSFI